MKIQESAEDYLETILMLSLQQPYVRSIDIATKMGFSKPSVSVAMKNLRTNGYIVVDDHGHISLAESGLEIAKMIYERHKVITAWLTSLGVNDDIAAEDACKIEHCISKETFSAMKAHIKQVSPDLIQSIEDI